MKQLYGKIFQYLFMQRTIAGHKSVFPIRSGLFIVQWFARFHLEIVEKIGLELCDRYPKADRNLVTLLVWLHDYGKILDFDHQYETTLSAGQSVLKKLDFSAEEISQALDYAEQLDRKSEIDLSKAPLEVQIVSSADGASHFIGPFFYLWWHENPEKPFEDLMRDNIKKAEKDWKRKIVLPEVKKAFYQRYSFLLEQAGKIPEKFL